MGRMEDESDDEAVFVGEDLTWRDVAHASSAYEPSYRTRASRVHNEDPEHWALVREKHLFNHLIGVW